jgi:hypothetical protein
LVSGTGRGFEIAPLRKHKRYGAFLPTTSTSNLTTDRRCMRTTLAITLIFFISLTATAQDNVNLREMVGFGCYFEGRYTKTVAKVTQLLETKKYDDISRLLSSRNTGKKYLAVIILQRLADNGQYKLSDNEKDLIEKAKLSDDKVSVCSGCTYFDKVSMKTILTEKDLIGASYWLDRTIKKE